MKLLDKSTRYYLVYSLCVFSIGSLFFYFSIQQVIYDGIDEALHQEKIVLVNNLKYEKKIDSLKLNEFTFIQRLDTKPHDQYDKYYTISPPKDSTLKHEHRQLESVFKHDGVYYMLKIKQSLKEEEELVESLVPVGIVMFMILLVGILVITNFISVRLWAPFYGVIDKLRSYDVKKGTIIEYEKMAVDEFDRLSKDLFVMTSKINDDFIKQKEFNENFSHELQTPLAIIQNNLELMIQSPNLKEEEMNHAASVLEAVRRITSLSKGLLLLARIDNNQFVDVTGVNMMNLSKKHIQFFSGIIEDRKISIEENYNNDNVWVSANQSLMDILFSNLLTNAIRHNIEEGGFISIEITKNQLIVKNSGKALEGDVKTIFDRFVKLGEKKNSIGLGLPIVKRICEVSGFSIFYENKGTEHIVTIDFD